MDTVDKYLTFVSLPQLIGGFFAALVVICFVPGRLRLSVSLAIMVVTFAVSIMTSLGTPTAAAKASLNGVLFLVIISALMHPGPRRRLPLIVWAYPLIAVLSFVYVLTVNDTAHALVIRLQWVLTTLSALLVLRVATNQERLMPILRGLAVGAAIAVLIAFSALIIEPRRSFEGFERFNPYGANPLQSGLLFALALPLFLYFSMRGSRMARPVWLGMALLTGCLVMLGVSRSIIIISFVSSLPLLWAMRRRPVMIGLAVIVLVFSVPMLLRTEGLTSFSRLLSFQDARWSLLSSYADIVRERPVLGLAGTSGMSAQVDTTMQTYSHNAYMAVLYLGGFSYFLPLFALLVYSLVCAFRVVWNRALMDFDPLLLITFAAMLCAMYMHGFSDIQLYIPTVSWTWMHVFLAPMFMTLATEIPFRREQQLLAGYDFGEVGMVGGVEGYEPLPMDYPVGHI